MNNKEIELVNTISDLINDCKKEIENVKSGKNIYATEYQLVLIINRLNEMKKNIETGELPNKKERSFGLWHIVIDNWGTGTPLGERIVQIEQVYEKI